MRDVWKVMLPMGLLLLAGCGGDGDATGGNDGSTVSTITMRDNAFVPANPTIAAGDVELVNEGESPHNLTVEGEGVDVDVDPGQAVTTTVDLAPGTYTVFCEFHRGQGMEGTLTVSG